MSIYSNMRWTISADGTARCMGISFSETPSNPVKVWHRDQTHIVFKIPAGKHWTGRGMDWTSHPGRYLVCEIIEDGESSLIAKELFDMPVSKKGNK